MKRCEHGHLVCAGTILDRAKDLGLRKTKALEAVVEALAAAGVPLPMSELESAQGVSGLCDRTTLFRLLNRLGEKGLVRRLGLHARAAYFTLAMPGGHHDYLICKECGSVEILEVPCPLDLLESEVAAQTGYSNLYHELELYGLCPSCAPSGGERK